jgi:hypothetical protein
MSVVEGDEEGNGRVGGAGAERREQGHGGVGLERVRGGRRDFIVVVVVCRFTPSSSSFTSCSRDPRSDLRKLLQGVGC